MNTESEVWDVISRILDVLVQEYQPERVVLFGSHVNDTADEESDIDLLIIKRTPQPFFQRLFEVQRLVSDVRCGYAFDPIVLSPDEIETRLQRGDQFIGDILGKGVEMYVREP